MSVFLASVLLLTMNFVIIALNQGHFEPAINCQQCIMLHWEQCMQHKKINMAAFAACSAKKCVSYYDLHNLSTDRRSFDLMKRKIKEV